jgi:hypothetical protein
LEPKNKVELVLALLPKAFAWAREAGPQQPLTSAVWKGDWSSPEKMTEMDRLQINLSDVITFHNYDSPTELERRIRWLKRYNRPAGPSISRKARRRLQLKAKQCRRITAPFFELMT